MKHGEHLFRFMGEHIAEAARREAEYHADREVYWTEESDRVVAQARALPATVRVQEQAVTNGKRYAIVADITGVQELQWRLDECMKKIGVHKQAADDFHLKAHAYATQPAREYELDPSDVALFRIVGGPREA